MTTKNNKTYKANDIAKYFIYLSSQNTISESGDREGITNLKLQKILYFAQAYYLGKLGRSLFDDQIEAWQYGPVIPTVYAKYRSHQNNSIIEPDSYPNTISEEDKNILKNIWDTFGVYSTSRLVDISHAHAPWKNVYNPSKKNKITQKSIKDYYTEIF